MKKITFILFCLSAFKTSFGQNVGSVHVNLATVVVYSTKTLFYESPDLLKENEIFGIHFNGGGGLWNASYTEKTNGTLLNIGTSLTVGKGGHYLEHNSSLNFHYGKSLKGSTSLYIGTLYKPYLGYRFQPVDKHIILKIGGGWKEVVQIGVGWRF